MTSAVALVSMLGWLALQVPRYRRAGAERRQQLKWLYSGAAVFVAALVASTVGPYAAGEAFGSDGPLTNDAIELGASVLLVCIGIAVLKYRLYDIDRIISRVISYLIITAVLAGVFAALVLFATSVLPVKAPVSVAAATWPRRRCSTRCGGGSSTRWTAGSTGPGTTPRRSWPRSPRGCARQWISTPRRPSC